MGSGLSRRRFLGAALLAPALPLLAACGWFEKSRPQPPATPTPLPPPTVTPTPAPVRLDSPAPIAMASRSAATSRATPTANPALRGGGQLLYTGALGGARGIVLADLAADARRLLVPGGYESLAWSPDGTRFAALGIATPEVPTQQVALFNADGRALARYAVPNTLLVTNTLRWSPDGRHLLYQFFDQASAAVATWIVAEDGQRRLPLDPEATVWRWLPNGRLAYTRASSRTDPPSVEAPLAIWSVDPAGNEPRREASGPFYPFDLSPDGTIIYAVGGFRTIVTPGPPVGSATTIVALDLVRGSSRTVFDAAAASAGATAWVRNAAVAPDTGSLAVVRGRLPVAAQQNTLGITNDLLLLDPAGATFSGDLSWQGELGRGGVRWSPHGLRLAYHTVGAGAGGGGEELRVVDLTGGPRAAFPIRAADPRLGLLVAWSGDDRLLAYVDSGSTGLMIAEPGTDRAYSFAADGNFPAWRPRT